jgi:ATP-dependent DNA helicase RecG
MTVITSEDILHAINFGEDSDWEFKSAKGGVPGSLWETYSAMANTEGGVIVLGVQQAKDERLHLDGLDNPEKRQKELWDCLNNHTKVSRNLLANHDLEIFSIGERKVIAMKVPRATRLQRPVFVGQNPLIGTYRRNHEGDYHCTPDEVGRMLADQSTEPADSLILEHFDLKDIDDESLRQYRNRFSSSKPDHPWLTEDSKGLLIKLGGWRRDRHTNKEGLTVAGILMFGKMESIRDPNAVPEFHLDYRERSATTQEVRWTDRLTLDGTWSGNLFQFYQRVIQKLSADLKIPFRLGTDLYREDDTPVHKAIREALGNALVHADYRGQGGVVIDKFPDRLEFSNPGNLLLSISQIFKGGISECRNKSLQLMFQMIGIGDKAGSGIDVIRQGWTSQNWRTPVIKEEVQPDRVRLVLPFVSTIPEAALERLRQKFGIQFNRLNQAEVQVMVTANIEGEVSNPRMQQICGVHSADLTKMLQGLVRQGFLVRDGQGRGTRYTIPSEEMQQALQSATDSLHSLELFPYKDYNVSGSGDLQPNSLHSQSDSLHKPEPLPHKDFTVSEPENCQPNSLHSQSDSLHSVTWESSQSLSSLPKNVLEQLRVIASPAILSARLRSDQIRQIVLQLCQEQFLTAAHLGELMKREPSSLRSRFLSPMVKEELLKLRYPHRPNRPDQSYKTKQ